MASLQGSAARHALRAARAASAATISPACPASRISRRDTRSTPCWRRPPRSASEVLLPLNRSGDEEGCHFENGVVRTPEGLQGGLRAVPRGRLDRARLPIRNMAARACRKRSNTLVEEMICSANLSFGLYPGLTHGAYRALARHGTRRAEGHLSAEAGRRRLVRHHVPDRAAMRHRSRPAAHQGGAAATTAATGSPAPRSSSPPASTT